MQSFREILEEKKKKIVLIKKKKPFLERVMSLGRLVMNRLFIL